MLIWLNQDSGVAVHAPQRWQKLGFDQKKQTQPVLRPSVAVFMRRPRQMLYALAHIGRAIFFGASDFSLSRGGKVG
jgi:hypothetical protein